MEELSTLNIEEKPKHSGVYLPPPALYVAIFVAGLTLDRARPLRIPGPSLASRSIVGVVLIVAAIGLAVWSISVFWRRGTSIVPIKASTALVESGPFRFSRNPMYVSLAVAYVGATLIANTLWPLVLFPLLILLVHSLVIVREERYMQQIFGQPYTEYRGRVRRWI